MLTLTKKTIRKQFRFDYVTLALLDALLEQNATHNESAVVRSAIYRMAQQDLSAEQFTTLVTQSVNMHKVVTDL